MHLCGADNVGWALDEQLRLMRVALEGVATLTDLADSDVVQSTWWQAVAAMPPHRLAGKRVLTYVAEDVLAFLQSPRSIAAREMVGCWLSCTDRESETLERLGLRHAYVPFIVDPQLFRPLQGDVADLRRRYGLPPDAYLVGSFQRDTEGHDLRSPKLVKGPDVFAETLRLLRARGLPVHAVLAGPRRFWLRRRLEELGVPFTYVGQNLNGDDVEVNTLARPILNELYNAIDLYFVSSRSEGVGPQAILEAAAAGCAIVSMRVGIASHTLEAASVVESAVTAADRIGQDIRAGTLAAVASVQRQRVISRHGPESIADRFRDLYRTIDAVPVFTARAVASLPGLRPMPLWRRALKRVSRSRRRLPRTVALWHEPHRPPPHGGDSQFTLALRKALRARGVDVVENSPCADAHVLMSRRFDIARFRREVRPGVPVVHRIGPAIECVGGDARPNDEEILQLNHDSASATTVASAWRYLSLLTRGFKPLNAIIVPDAVDPDLFHATGRMPFDRRRKIRLIANATIGAPEDSAVYGSLAQHLDRDRYEFAVVSGPSEPIEGARRLAPVESEERAVLLREHDVFVAASPDGASSDGVLEALACGLPVMYLNDGGHQEIVGHGGLPFESIDDLLRQLDRLTEHYDTYQQLIAPPTLDVVAGKYLALLQEVLA